MSRKTIGESPFDSLITTPTEEPEANSPKKAKVNSNRDESKSDGTAKQRLTVQISDEVVERAKNAVYWTRGLTLAQLTEQALEKALNSIENSSVIFCDKTGEPIKKKGEPYPKREDSLKSGRPVK
jgi:RNA polymerase-binding transcription factor DksA